MADLQSMIGKNVEVVSNGIAYTGVLIEVSDVDVTLKGPMQWISLPVSSVSEIRIPGEYRRTVYDDAGNEG